MTRAYNTATTQQNSGGAVSGVTAGKNPVLNSNFSVWQRGTSFSFAASTGASSNTYTADRWQTKTQANQAIVVSRQATNDSTNLPNIQYCLRFQRNSGQTGTGDLDLIQNFETVNSIPFAGKTVTVSFYGRKGADYSATSSGLQLRVFTGTGTDENIYNGYTGTTVISAGTAALTTTWQRFSYTISIGATTKQIAYDFFFSPTGTASTNDYYEITGVQMEVGSVATPYAPYSPTYQGELAACQRYYYVHSRTQNWANGQASSTSGVTAPILLPIEMRVAPTITLAPTGASSGNINFLSSSLNFPSTTGTISADAITKNGFQIVGSGFTSSFTAGNSSLVYSNGINNVYAASAEL